MRGKTVATVLKTMIPQGEPILITGPPGVGKTDIVKTVCEDLGFKYHIFHPVLDDRVDYKGLPGIVDGRAEFLTFGNLRILEEATETTVIIFDDLGQAMSDVQASIMQLILGRELNGKKISNHITFVAMTNRKEDKAGVSGILAPLLDRFVVVIPLEFHIDDWAAWMMNKGYDSDLIAFARVRPEHMTKQNTKAVAKMQKSPTPRSVAGVGRLLEAGLDSRDLLECAVGEAWATEFHAFRTVIKDVPDVRTIWKNPKTAPLLEGENQAATRYALMAALAYHCQNKHIDAMMTYLNRVSPEYAVVALKDCASRLPKLVGNKKFFKFVKDNNAVFEI